jgi:quercetin dioxygenase-like cupin family protein
MPELAAEQPISTEIHIADGVFVKTMVIQKAGTGVPQHAHVYDHVSVLVKGAIKVWRDGVYDGRYVAPFGIVIPARTKHLFVAEEDGTTVLCVHDVGAAEAVEIAEEHQMVEV